MSDPCPAQGSLVERELSRLATEYREAHRLKAYMAGVFGQLEEVTRTTCAIPSFFDLNTAIGDQLTLIGKRMGFPRFHCVCNAQPLYGIACEDTPSLYTIAGPCDDATWLGCDGTSDLCIGEDEVYRAHLKARRYQILRLYDIQSLGAAIRHLWGPTAWVPRAENGEVVIAPGRDLTAAETARLAISLRILPVAPGIRTALHFGAKPILGAGEGWAGACSNGVFLCPVPVDPYACA